MSGIATATHALAGIVRSVSLTCRVAGTRKTSPGFRRFDKKAVVIGGGDPHRMNLSDGILIKDNHLAVVHLEQAIRAARMHSRYKKIEVEVESAADAIQAAETGADIIMLDNMTPAQAKETVSVLGKRGLRDRVTLEISGGINETTLRDYAACGVDVISMGALTHTVRNFSLSLDIAGCADPANIGEQGCIRDESAPRPGLGGLRHDGFGRRVSLAGVDRALNPRARLFFFVSPEMLE